MASSTKQKSSNFGKKVVIVFFFIATFICLPLYISVQEVTQSQSSFSTVTLINHLRLPDDESVTKRFAAYGYNLTEIRKGHAEVPNLFLERLPRELTSLNDVNVKKDLFISSLLPPILKVNEYILYERKRLLEIINRIEVSGKTSSNDLYWLRRKMIRYRLNEFNIEELHQRMNIIPPSLALTQAAIETGWGSSRFAQDANALYGQWTWDDEDGIIPLGREKDATHSIKKFDNLISAVESYALNLNTHQAYEDFRMERNKFTSPESIKVYDLLVTLIFYSELGYEYIDNLNSIIRANELGSYDTAKLARNSFQEIRLNPTP